MLDKEYTKLMIRLEEGMRHIAEDVIEIKSDVKELFNRVDSFENTLSEHKKYMEEHPRMCSDILEVKNKLDQINTIKKTRYDMFNKLATLVNAALILYLTYKGVLG